MHWYCISICIAPAAAAAAAEAEPLGTEEVEAAEAVWWALGPSLPSAPAEAVVDPARASAEPAWDDSVRESAGLFLRTLVTVRDN